MASSLARLCAATRRTSTASSLTGGHVLLLCYPRLLGYTFNPLSVYFCYGDDDRLSLIIYEVRNTFGEIHSYVLPVRPGEVSAAGVRQAQDKLFYVSPFVEMAMRYHFRISPPGERVKLRILETDCEGPLLAATFSGRRQPLTTRSLLRAFAALPLVTLKIVAAIHWEALRLWLKGARSGAAVGMPQMRKTPLPPWRAPKAALIYDTRYPRRGGALWSGDGRWARPFTTRRKSGHRATAVDGLPWAT